MLKVKEETESSYAFEFLLMSMLEPGVATG